MEEKIKWNTDKPKVDGRYLVTLQNKEVDILCYYVSDDAWQEPDTLDVVYDVVAWANSPKGYCKNE